MTRRQKITHPGGEGYRADLISKKIYVYRFSGGDEDKKSRMIKTISCTSCFKDLTPFDYCEKTDTKLFGIMEPNLTGLP